MVSDGSATEIMTSAVDSPLSSSQLLASSVSSIASSSSRHASSQIAKTYRQSSSLFLTRRLAEALSILSPIVLPPKLSASTNGSHDRVPIASASRSTRIKVWSLYLTILDAIVNLGPEDGKSELGNKEWREIAKKAQEGGAWEEVVKYGYSGIEGEVDADVVINL
jgi:hypothetical protein